MTNYTESWMYNSNTDELTLISLTRGVGRLTIKQASKKSKEEIISILTATYIPYALAVEEDWDKIFKSNLLS